MSATNPFAALPSGEDVPVPVPPSTLPPGSLKESLVAMAVSVVLLALVDVGTHVAGPLLAAGLAVEGKQALVVSQLLALAMTAGAEATAGAFMVAGAYGVSTHLAGGPPPSVGAVVRRVAGRWAAWRVLNAVGSVMIVPELLLSVLMGIYVDPVAVVEDRPGKIRSPKRAFIPLLGVWLLSGVLVGGWSFLNYVVPTDNGYLLLSAASLVIWTAIAATWVAWIHIWRTRAA